MRTSSLALATVMLCTACSDPAGPEDNIMITGTVSVAGSGQPLSGGTVRLIRRTWAVFPETRTIATGVSDTGGGYELRANLRDMECYGLYVEIEHETYYQASVVTATCGRQSINVPLVMKIINVNVDPSPASVAAGSETAFEATPVLADGTHSPASAHVIGLSVRTTSMTDCGRIEYVSAAAVYRAPESAPEGGCSDAGGAVVTITVWADNFHHEVDVTITES